MDSLVYTKRIKSDFPSYQLQREEPDRITIGALTYFFRADCRRE